MRVWCFHPNELDDQRLLAQHNEVHMLMSLIKYNLSKNRSLKGEWGKWCDDRGIAALCHLHDLVVSLMRAKNWVHHTPIQNHMSLDMIRMSVSGEPDIEEIVATSDWPPSWIENRDIVRDVCDFQRRLRNENKLAILNKSIARWGDLSALGSLGGTISDSKLLNESFIVEVIERSKLYVG